VTSLAQLYARVQRALTNAKRVWRNRRLRTGGAGRLAAYVLYRSSPGAALEGSRAA